MLQLIGPTDTPEYHAARDLAERIGVAWADIATNPQHQMTIVAAAKCYGQPVCDIDMLVLYYTNTPYSLPAQPDDYRTVHLASLCLVIEVKEHPPEQVRFVGTQTEVQYHSRWHNVSEQNYKQRFSVKGYLEEQGIAPPFIMNLIWLRNVPEAHIPASLHNLIGQDTTWETILHRVRHHMRPKMHAATRTLCISAGNELPRVVNLFSAIRKPQPTDIERTKMKAMTQLPNATTTGQVPAYVTNLGTQLLIIQGRGGTGKTATLLRLAHLLYEHRQARVLLLTYNRALVADIRRLLALLGLDDLYDYKFNSFVPAREDVANPSFHRTRAAHDYAMRWLMIPLTRGIHTLVIQVSPLTPVTHPVVATLRAAAERFPNLVEWHSAESTIQPS